MEIGQPITAAKINWLILLLMKTCFTFEMWFSKESLCFKSAKSFSRKPLQISYKFFNYNTITNYPTRPIFFKLKVNQLHKEPSDSLYNTNYCKIYKAHPLKYFY